MNTPSLDRPLLLKGGLLLPEGLRSGSLLVSGALITAVNPGPGTLPPDVETVHAGYIAPGFIDLQVNGAFGCEVEQPDAIRRIAARLPETGVTAFLPTVVTSAPEVYRRVLDLFAQQRDALGARPLGLHLEGPYLSPARAGAHRRELMQPADDLLAELLPAGAVALMTLAPEREDALERIRRLRERGVVVSLGHTDASYEVFRQGVDAGASMATHLFNAMSPFAHRAPGAIGAALADERVTVGLIPDGIHSHEGSLRLALRAKGWRRIALVTDAMAAMGMGPGTWQLGGQQVRVDGSSARLADGTLAGSILTMDQAVRNMVQLAGATVEEALRMASEVPATVLGLQSKGRLAAGADADLVLLDADLRVEGTVTGGRWAWRPTRSG